MKNKRLQRVKALYGKSTDDALGIIKNLLATIRPDRPSWEHIFQGLIDNGLITVTDSFVHTGVPPASITETAHINMSEQYRVVVEMDYRTLKWLDEIDYLLQTVSECLVHGHYDANILASKVSTAIQAHNKISKMIKGIK